MQVGGGVGRRRPLMQPNYHTLTNNAVFPTEETNEVIQYHTKVRRDNKPKLAPTLRGGTQPGPTQILEGRLARQTNDSPGHSPKQEREGSPNLGSYLSEY